MANIHGSLSLCCRAPVPALNKAVLLLREERMVPGEGWEGALPGVSDRVVLKVFQADYRRLKSCCFWCPGAVVRAPWRSLKIPED